MLNIILKQKSSENKTKDKAINNGIKMLKHIIKTESSTAGKFNVLLGAALFITFVLLIFEPLSIMIVKLIFDYNMDNHTGLMYAAFGFFLLESGFCIFYLDKVNSTK